MTGPEPTAPEPVAEPYAVVEAFLDGEAVDPQEAARTHWTSRR